MAARKQIIFDIDTKVAEEILGRGYRKAYLDIRKHLEKNNFIHIEGSSYESIKGMQSMDIYYLLSDLKKECPYLEKCIRDIRQTNISYINSLNHLFHYDEAE